MRVVSLNQFDGGPTVVDAEVCIVGAGAAGLYLARRLSGIDGRVVVLEAGPKAPVSAAEVGLECEFSGATYRGATEGRAFGLGGTTARWGGQLIPFLGADGVRDNDVLNGAWRHVLQVVDQHQRGVAEALGMQEHADTASKLRDGLASIFSMAGLAPVLSRWLPFRRRNFSWLVQRGGTSPNAATIYCDAVAAEWRLDHGHTGLGRIREVVARNGFGRSVRVRARRYVIAAGAIESARILHEMNAAGAGRVFRPSAAVGRYLSDHLSFRIAEFAAEMRGRIADAFGPRFSNGVMRTWRFVEESPRAGDCRYFGHVLFPTDNHGYQLARSVLQGMQTGKMPALGMKEISRGAIGLMNIAWRRWIDSKLYVSCDAPSYLQLDMEQRPDYSNSVRLSDRLDRYGRPLALVDWRISGQDEVDMNNARSTFLSRWSHMGSAFASRPPASKADTLLKPHDAYHPVGTCRLGSDAEAVVGLDLKAHGTDNVFVLSTGLFPSAGSANPTFSLLCFAEMLAHKMKDGAIS